MDSITCYGVVRGNDWMQEHYESASGHARRRAAQLRKCGLSVTVSPLGPQVTGVGVIKMTMLTIRGELDMVPDVKIERI